MRNRIPRRRVASVPDNSAAGCSVVHWRRPRSRPWHSRSDGLLWVSERQAASRPGRRICRRPGRCNRRRSDRRYDYSFKRITQETPDLILAYASGHHVGAPPSLRAGAVKARSAAETRRRSVATRPCRRRAQRQTEGVMADSVCAQADTPVDDVVARSGSTAPRARVPTKMQHGEHRYDVICRTEVHGVRKRRQQRASHVR
jgi:hypothetical protein